MITKIFTAPPKPFIKWAGGKTQLLPTIEAQLRGRFNPAKTTYVEPFVGGGAVLFWLLRTFPNIKNAVINDINAKLINLYRTVKYNPLPLIKSLTELQKSYLPLNQEHRTEFFMQKRHIFNQPISNEVEQAALFIFLNRTCFNGLYRENSKGHFNVPHGKYVMPTICDAPTIFADSQLLQRVEIRCGDFADTLDCAASDTLYYLDPPYRPLSQTSSFNQYVKENFDDGEQIRLRDFCNLIAEKGAHFLSSNSDPRGANPQDTFFDDIYEDYNIRRVDAVRMVNANPDKRGRLTELLISNLDTNLKCLPQSLF